MHEFDVVRSANQQQWTLDDREGAILESLANPIGLLRGNATNTNAIVAAKIAFGYI